MNEKIKELWDKAVTLVEQEPDGDWSLDACKEKFAELIVEECYQVCKNNLVPLSEYDSDEAFKYNEGVTDFAIMINRHFGVEE